MNNIKKLRQEKGLTQNELANIFELDQTTVSKWELGKAFPDTQMLIKLSSYFDVSTDYLLGISQLFYPDKIKNQMPDLSTEEQLLIDTFRTLPESEKTKARDYVNYLADRSHK